MMPVQTPPLEAQAPAGLRPSLKSTDVERKRARERRKRLVRTVRYAIAFVVVAAAAVGVVLALRPRPVLVDVARAVRGPLVVEVEESGVTRVKDRYVVSAPVAGALSRLVLEPGDPVREGDPVALIAPSESPLLDERARSEAEARLGAALSALGRARAQAERAGASKELAERELTRARSLAKSGSMSQQALDQSEFAARMQDAELASARFAEKVANEEARIARVALGRGGAAAARDRHVEVISPMSGRVLRVQQKSAGVVAAGAPLVEIGDPADLEVVVDLLTTDAVRVSPGTPVAIDGWGGDVSLAGRVRRVEPSAFTRPSALGVDEQRVNVVVALVDPPAKWAALGDGYRVEARLVLYRAEGVIKVPHGAVFRRGSGWAAYRAENGVARLTTVAVGHRGETDVEITSGLPEGALVIVHPGDRVKDGIRIDAR